jgi:hypothetical protein
MNTQELKKLGSDLCDAANQLRQGAGLKATEYASPILISHKFLTFLSL